MKGTAARISRRRFFLMVLFSMLLIAGCGGDDPTGPDASIDALVGDWVAQRLEVTMVADPTRVADLIEGGASFSINVQPSGQYTAVLTVLGFSQTEIGFLVVEGDELVLNRQHPSADTTRADYALLDGGSRIRLLGPTEFDFDGDQVGEPSTLLTELVRR